MAILTVSELRKHLPDFPTGADNDAVLTRLLAAAEAAINFAAGTEGARTEYHGGGYRHLFLSRATAAVGVSTVKEDFDGSVVTLATNDWRLLNGNVLYRLSTGTNAATRWSGLVEVVYTPTVTTALREMTQVLLCQQFVNYHPGLTSETVGDWSQTFAANSVYNWALERERILATLHVDGRMAVVR